MSTSITTFQKSKTGDLDFPFVSEFGIIANPALAEYLDAMASFGHDWQSADVQAFNTYISAGENDGWLEHMPFIAPMWGDSGDPRVLGVPLVSALGNGGNCTIMRSGIDWDGGTEWEDLAEISDGKVLGVKPLFNRALATPWTVADLIAKPGYANAGNPSGGVTCVGITPTASGVHYRLWGPPGMGMGDPSGDRTTRLVRLNTDSANIINSLWFGAVVIGPFDYEDGVYTHVGFDGTTRWRRGKTLATLATNDVQTDATPPYAIDMTAAAERHFLVGAVGGGSSAPYTVLNGSADQRVRWFALDDGSLSSNTHEAAHRAALGTLLTALEKDFS